MAQEVQKAFHIPLNAGFSRITEHRTGSRHLTSLASTWQAHAISQQDAVALTTQTSLQKTVTRFERYLGYRIL